MGIVYRNFFAIVIVVAQVDSCLLFAQEKDTVYQKDIMEVLFKKQYKKMLEKNKKKKVLISVFPAFGSTPATGLAGVVATNFAFKLADTKRTGLSSVFSSASYTAKQQFILPVRSTLYSKDNKYILLGDWRFTKYPQNTYGLGSFSKRENEVLVDYLYAKFYQQLLRNIGSEWYVGGGVFLDQYWNIEEEDWEKPYQSEFKKYGYGTEGTRAYAGGFGFNLLWDDRKNVNNPKEGSYGSFIYRFNPAWLANDQPWESIYADFRRYFYVPSKMRKNILGFWFLYWGITRGNPPYLLLPSNGWDTQTSSGRGYIQGRFRGKHAVTFETEYRYGITRNGLLGGVVFANVSSFTEPASGKLETLNPAIGAGLRIKLNKASQTNLIVDFAYGLHQNQGFYLDVGEIF